MQGTVVDILRQWPDELVDVKIEDGKSTIIYHIDSKLYLMMSPSNELVPSDEVVMINQIDRI